MQTGLPGMYIPADLETYIQLHLLTYYIILSSITCREEYYYTDYTIKNLPVNHPNKKFIKSSWRWRQA